MSYRNNVQCGSPTVVVWIIHVNVTKDFCSFVNIPAYHVSIFKYFTLSSYFSLFSPPFSSLLSSLILLPLPSPYFPSSYSSFCLLFLLLLSQLKITYVQPMNSPVKLLFLKLFRNWKIKFLRKQKSVLICFT